MPKTRGEVSRISQTQALHYGRTLKMLRSSDFEETQSEISRAFTFREPTTSKSMGAGDEEKEVAVAAATVVVAEDEAAQR